METAAEVNVPKWAVIFYSKDRFEWDGVVGEGLNSMDIHYLDELITTGHFDPVNSQMDIARYLDNDRTIDLYKLEVATRIIVKYQKSLDLEYKIDFVNVEKYCEYREIALDSLKFKEEITFITNFVIAVSEDELYEPEGEESGANTGAGEISSESRSDEPQEGSEEFPQTPESPGNE